MSKDNSKNYDEMSEIAANGGLPVRYPHWSFEMEYEELISDNPTEEFIVVEGRLQRRVIYAYDDNSICWWGVDATLNYCLDTRHLDRIESDRLKRLDEFEQEVKSGRLKPTTDFVLVDERPQRVERPGAGMNKVTVVERPGAGMNKVTVERLRFAARSKIDGEALTHDHIKIATAGPYQVVVGDHYQDGQLCFVIPPGAIVPDKLLDEMWLKGKLSGANKNRVKARKMFGVTSEALIYGASYTHNGELVNSPSWNPAWVEGQDITGEVEIQFS